MKKEFNHTDMENEFKQGILAGVLLTVCICVVVVTIFVNELS
jgi:hypothetical protein